MIGDFAVEDEGQRIAIAAVATLDAGWSRQEVFVLDRRSGETQRFNVGGEDVHSVAWLDPDHLLVVVSDSSFPAVPSQRELRRLVLRDGSATPFP